LIIWWFDFSWSLINQNVIDTGSDRGNVWTRTGFRTTDWGNTIHGILHLGLQTVVSPCRIFKFSDGKIRVVSCTCPSADTTRKTRTRHGTRAKKFFLPHCRTRIKTVCVLLNNVSNECLIPSSGYLVWSSGCFVEYNGRSISSSGRPVWYTQDWNFYLVTVNSVQLLYSSRVSFRFVSNAMPCRSVSKKILPRVVSCLRRHVSCRCVSRLDTTRLHAYLYYKQKQRNSCFNCNVWLLPVPNPAAYLHNIHVITNHRLRNALQ